MNPPDVEKSWFTLIKEIVASGKNDELARPPGETATLAYINSHVAVIKKLLPIKRETKTFVPRVKDVTAKGAALGREMTSLKDSYGFKTAFATIKGGFAATLADFKVGYDPLIIRADAFKKDAEQLSADLKNLKTKVPDIGGKADEWFVAVDALATANAALGKELGGPYTRHFPKRQAWQRQPLRLLHHHEEFAQTW